MDTNKIIGAGAALTMLATLGACKPKDIDNPDVAAGYQENVYNKEIVTGRERKDYADQGKGIKPKTLRSIEDTITSVYERDFERCLEDEMAKKETRFMRCVFTVEFKIDTAGDAGSAKILEIGMSMQNAKGATIGNVDPEGMKTCISSSIDEWTFDPAPEVDYVHTYHGQVGEAF